jgi:hypothetical protein
MENGLRNEKPSPARDPQRMFTTNSAISIATSHLKKTRIIQALLILVAIPIVYVVWVVAQRQADLDVIFTARAAMLTCLPFVAAAIFSPLFLRYPKEVRWRGFVMQWFSILCARTVYVREHRRICPTSQSGGATTHQTSITVT